MSGAATLPIWIQIFPAFLTPVIGFLACWVAYQQYRTNHLKLRYDLFDRRLFVYDALRKFLGQILRDGKTSHEQCLDLLRETSQAEFLFGQDINAYIKDVYSKGLTLKSLNDELYGEEHLPVGKDRSAVAHKESELLRWFGDQFDVARDHFGRYMHLGNESALQDLLKKYANTKNKA